MTALALTKLDVLADLPEVSVCVAYKVDGKELDEPPIDPDDIARAEPVYARFPGWGKLPAAPHGVADLPAAARTYIETIERMAGVPFCLVSVGPDRTETIRLHDPFA
jgi:adenylosuccinate synthase